MIPDSSFDAVVITLVLCSVQSVAKTLSEVKRVLKPGGSYYFVEHVISPNSDSTLRTIQNALSNIGFWPFFFDGCYLNR